MVVYRVAAPKPPRCRFCGLPICLAPWLSPSLGPQSWALVWVRPLKHRSPYLGCRRVSLRVRGGEGPSLESREHDPRPTGSDPRNPVCDPREDLHKQTARSPYLLGSGGGRSSDVGALARGAAEGCSSKARRGQRGFGSVGGAGVVGLPESWARGPEGLLALRQALILQHLLWAQHTPPSHWARSTLARGPVAL